MAKFKVGDIVKGIEDNGYFYTNENMLKAKVIEIKDGSMAIKVMKHKKETENGMEYVVLNDETKFSLIPNNESIHITQKDNIVHAVYKNGDDIIRRSEAKCHPEDEFDFEIGAKLAFDRLGFVDEKNVTPKEEKMVFDKYKFIELRGLYGFKGYKKNSSWVDKSHGKSRDESEFLLENEFMVKESEWCE